ncbi:MAG: hypothetical protein HYY05_03595 [Chloroflexi bacterium]|nr:hypothetical protein [Chloroflexota bacterium]
MSPYEPLDLARVRTVPLGARSNKLDIEQLAGVPQPGRSFALFIDSLPDQLAARSLRAVVAAVVAARRSGRPVVFALGAHVIKCGLNPVLIALMRRGVVSALAFNGAGAIHDLELALVGGTSEDVAAGLGDGTFGMVQETGSLINEAVAQAYQSDPEGTPGLGAILGDLIRQREMPHREHSLLAVAREHGIPATVHVALGTDIVHMHPTMRGDATGAATLYDFRLLAAVVADLEGGVYINVGSAVVLPEVFLKALTVARNLGHTVDHFTTVNLDMLQHYRPNQNVVHRPTLPAGKGYSITGHHEIMLPLLAQAIVDALAREDGPHPNPLPEGEGR